jgi:hypothetical protein
MSPPAAGFWDDWQTVAALVIFVGTYFVIAVGKLPGYRLDRAGAPLLGAALMVGFGVLPLDAAYRAIDFDTITLLLGMMILVANLKLSGFFRLVNGWIMGRARHPWRACRTRSAPGLSSPWPRRSPAISHWSDRWPISSWRSARGDTASRSASGRISRSARRSRF